MINFLLEDATPAPSIWSTWYLWVGLAVIFIAFMAFSAFSNKKRREQANTVVNSLKPGVKIKTIGGVVGEIVEIIVISPTEKHIVIKTGSGDNASTMTFDINAVGMIINPAAQQAPISDADIMPSDEEVARLLNGGKKEDKVEVFPETETAAAETEKAEDVKEEPKKTAPAKKKKTEEKEDGYKK